MHPTVSVLTAVHNGERYLEESSASILGQEFQDFEFLMVDDGSTDRTPEILERLRRQDPRVVVIRQEHAGQTRSLIRAVQAARGEYLARHDADDLSLPQRFERQVRYLEAHPSVGVLGCATDAIDERGRVLGPVPMRHGPSRVREGLKTLKVTMVHTSVMMRRAAYDSVGGYREAFALSQDIDLWLRMVQRYDVDNLPEPLVRWRLNAGGVYTARRELQLKYGGIALAFARERQRYGTDSYDLLERAGDDLGLFATHYRLRGFLYALWGELLFRGLQDPSPGRGYLARALAQGRLQPKTLGLYGWSLLGHWPGGAPMKAGEARSS